MGILTDDKESLLSGKDLQSWSAGVQKVGEIVGGLKEMSEMKEERHVQRDIDKLKKELLKAEQERKKLKELNAMKAEREKLQKKIQAIRAKQLKGMI